MGNSNQQELTFIEPMLVVDARAFKSWCAHALEPSASKVPGFKGRWRAKFCRFLLGLVQERFPICTNLHDPAPPQPALQDGAHAYDAVKEILKEEGPSIHTRMTKADMLMAKDGALGEDGEWDCLGFWKKEGQDHHLKFKWLVWRAIYLVFFF